MTTTTHSHKPWTDKGGHVILPSRVPTAAISTIQLVPLQASRMCSGAALARSVQVMSRPWLFS